MNKQPRNRLDDTLNAILIAVGGTALLTMTIDGVRNDQAAAAAATVQVSAPAAPVAVASLQAPVARSGVQVATR